jgi:peptide chain release factor 3
MVYHLTESTGRIILSIDTKQRKGVFKKIMQSDIKALSDEVQKRRTFAIISHPDAGKTTMTEKLLLYGGAIHLAGSVKSRKSNKYATSDWMEIEKKRGISVTSSVLNFSYQDFSINILDTPGHQDFSEDTYRTLVAADSAVMLIDGAKGVEAQTIKLFHVCRMRKIPIFTFINKMDRASKNPFELMEELEQVLGISAYPMNWPIGTDGDFKGVYNRENKHIELFGASNHGQTVVSSTRGTSDDPIFLDLLGPYHHQKLTEDIALLDMAGDAFDKAKVLRGELTPLFFGSAMTNFGVEPFLQDFLKLAPPPIPKPSSIGEVDPVDGAFTGFIFKIQANMNPTHRDRIAFLRICSGKFEKGMTVTHVRSGKEIRLSQPQQFMAQDRNMVEEAYPGDIIGLFDPGIFSIGDTLSEKNAKLEFDGIPIFPAEHFARISAKDTMRRKAFVKGIHQLSEEGAIQIFKQIDIGTETFIVGTVGVLQFEVLEHRLMSEYGVEIRLQNLPHKHARWLKDLTQNPKDLTLNGSTLRLSDKLDRPALLFENEWSIGWAKDKNRDLELLEIR